MKPWKRINLTPGSHIFSQAEITCDISERTEKIRLRSVKTYLFLDGGLTSSFCYQDLIKISLVSTVGCQACGLDVHGKRTLEKIGVATSATSTTTHK